MKKIFSLLLIAAMLLSLAACGETPAPTVQPEPEPAPAVSEPEPAVQPEPETITYEEMRQAIVETALSYYYHNPYTQYDNTSLCSAASCTPNLNSFTAEDAGADQYVYSVCTDYGYRVYKEATGWTFAKSPNGLMVSIPKIAADDPLMVCKFGRDGEADAEKAVRECRGLLQVGDLITFEREPNNGHQMIFVGDVLGDGTEYILHCSHPNGGELKLTTGVNLLEPDGAILLDPVDILFTEGNDRFLGSKYSFTVIRPFNVIEEGTLTEAALTRLHFPRMEIWKTFDCSQYHDLKTGDTLTVTVTVTNRSGEDYTGLTVTEPIPAGQTILSAEGAKQDGGALVWTLDVPAGQTAVCTYQIRVDGAAGQTVTVEAGSVGGVSTRSAVFQIGSLSLTQAQLDALAEIGTGKIPASVTFDDLNTVNTFYKDVLGLDAGLPTTLQALLDGVTQRKAPLGAQTKCVQMKEPEKITADFAAVQKMLVQKHLFGKFSYTSMDQRDRVIEFLEERYLPGDVFVSSLGAESSSLLDASRVLIQIVLGGGKVLCISGKDGVSVQSFEESIARNIRCDFGLLLRPTMGIE